MKIALLSGALKNAGDFLITNRTKELFESSYNGAKIKTYIRNFPLSESQIDEISSMDLAVVAGGPVYNTNLIPDSVNFAKNLNSINAKFAIVGGVVWTNKFLQRYVELQI